MSITHECIEVVTFYSEELTNKSKGQDKSFSSKEKHYKKWKFE